MKKIGGSATTFWISTVAIQVAATLFLALVPPAMLSEQFQFWDKAQHALTFAVLAATSYIAFPSAPGRVAMSFVGFGALIEILQATLTTTRNGDVYDWLADALGIGVGLAMVSLARWIRRSAQQRGSI